ncbi:MAG: Regulator of chromosome condensation, partial [Candidatus Uhrbacteria bacterium GW2011_GWD2_52_7]
MTTMRVLVLFGIALLSACMFPKLPTCGDGKICLEDDTGGVIDSGDTATHTGETSIDTFDTTDTSDTSETAESGETGDSAPVDNDGDGVTSDIDCNDNDADVYQNAPEDCTATQDYNCDGLYGSTDNDGDGFAACLECDDTNSAVNPSATETCNDGVDDDCDGLADDSDAEGATGTLTWYLDADSDSFGDSASSFSACEQYMGTVADATDCDDAEASVNPDASEVCNSGVDDNCDGIADDADASVTGTTTWYMDGDSDGYGDESLSLDACEQPSGYVASGDDCDDSDASLTTSSVWYRDLDGDGYGDASATSSSCTQPSGYVDNDDDCNDRDSGVSPSTAWEYCNGEDDDCDGLLGTDDPDYD